MVTKLYIWFLVQFVTDMNISNFILTCSVLRSQLISCIVRLEIQITNYIEVITIPNISFYVAIPCVVMNQFEIQLLNWSKEKQERPLASSLCE